MFNPDKPATLTEGRSIVQGPAPAQRPNPSRATKRSCETRSLRPKPKPRTKPHLARATGSPCRRPRIPSSSNNVNQHARKRQPRRRPAATGGRLIWPTPQQRQDPFSKAHHHPPPANLPDQQTSPTSKPPRNRKPRQTCPPGQLQTKPITKMTSSPGPGRTAHKSPKARNSAIIPAGIGTPSGSSSVSVPAILSSGTSAPDR
jgi:hypothetical protein